MTWPLIMTSTNIKNFLLFNKSWVWNITIFNKVKKTNKNYIKENIQILNLIFKQTLLKAILQELEKNE